MVKYFGYGSNRNEEMMAAIVGNKNLKGVPGRLIGFELCIQRLEDIPDNIGEKSPVKISPRQVIKNNFGDFFELYICRINPEAEVFGTIWDLTEEERNLVKDWEMLDFGMQEEIKGVAIENETGKIFSVSTEGLLDPAIHVNKVIAGGEYDDFIVSKEKIIEVANKSRQEYFERID